MCIKNLLVIWIIFLVLPAKGQIINTLPADEQTQEGYFLYEVKLIDEFIERFNDEPGSYIRQQSKALYGSDSIISRRKLLRSLFDKNKAWGENPALFINQVLTSAQNLSFTDSNWYAEVECIFSIDGKNVQVPLILHIRQENDGAKWMIAGLGTSNISSRIVKFSPIMPMAKSIDNFIPTSSHGTNFIVLSQVLTSTMNASAYLEPELLQTERAQKLVSLIKLHKLTFKYAKSIRYRFFSIGGWVFTVGYFKRKETNSGWLISDLIPADAAQKSELIKKLLYPKE